MRRAIVVALGTGAFISSAAALSLSGAEEPRNELTRVQYEIALRGVEAAGPARLARCDGLAAADKEVCRTEAQARDMVRVAEIEQDFRHSHQSARALQRARIDARYQVERARCGLQPGGFKREKCLVKAHAARGRALLEAAGPYETRF